MRSSRCWPGRSIEPASDGPSSTSFTWAKFTASLCGPTRELEPGERPADWIETDMPSAPEVGEPSETPTAEAPDPDPPACRPPQLYRVQFTASEQYVSLLEEARDLLAHAVPDRAIEEVHLRAMRLLVAELKKKKFAVTDKPRAPTPKPDPPRRGRHLSARVRREVWERDGGRCLTILHIFPCISRRKLIEQCHAWVSEVSCWRPRR